ncbi:MAG: carbohydrate ABC transporter permease, partial [Halanaerobium sp.]
MTKSQIKLGKKILFFLVLALVVIYLLFPFYWAIVSSLKSESQLSMTPATLIPRDPDTGEISFFTRNYEAIFANGG